MNTSPQALALIKVKVAALPGGWVGNTDAQVVASLNAPSVANPITTAPQVPKPFATRDLMAPLDAAALAKLQALPSLARLLDDIASQMIVGMENWIPLLQAGGTITAAQAQALGAIIHATQPDPAWQPQISWAQSVIGRPVDLSDVALARIN